MQRWLTIVCLALGAQARAQDAPAPARELSLELNSTARLAGTSGDLAGAKIVARRLAEAGWSVEIDERVVLLSLPRRLAFALYADSDAARPELERVERFDPDAIPCGDVPLYNAWSASGKVRAKVVDVGYGLRADFERLAAAGIDVRGCIALARYGRAYRGVKAQLAEEFGCVGVLLYSESKSDGGEKGAVWPAGPWKPDWDGQRGSILPIANAPGDPSTPGIPAPHPGEEFAPLSEAQVAALLRAAQHLGERARGGWQPQHTLRFAFWDAEEFGLIGSTEYGEAHRDELRARCLAYLNSDASVSGTSFGASGTPGMLGVLKDVCERVRTADGSQSLWQQWSARADGGQPRLSLPGAGSDFTVFAHHLCVPVLDVGFSGNDGGQYHTRFDDFPMVERYLDPGFVGHELAGRLLAELAVELASRPHAGFDVAEAALAFAGHARALGAELLDAPRAEELAADFERVAEAARGAAWDGASRPTWFFRSLQSPYGLAGREWFTNPLWAPGLETGYASETFVALRAAARADGAAGLDEELRLLREALAGSVSQLAGPFRSDDGARFGN